MSVARPGLLLLACVLLLTGCTLGGREEPRRKWFRFYTGSMLPLESVAVLCNAAFSTNVRTIRVLDDGRRVPARYERWHFPTCIEALPGRYELEVDYFSRKTLGKLHEVTTEHSESTAPSVVVWHAEAGGVYRLAAIFTEREASSGAAPRSRVAARSSLGTSRFELEEGEWAAQIQRVEDWDDLDEPVLEYREAWRRYESGVF